MLKTLSLTLLMTTVSVTLLSGCNSPVSPTQPSPQAPSPAPSTPFVAPTIAQFTIVVVDNKHRPVPAVPVSLVLNGGALASEDSLIHRTADDGTVTWQVKTGPAYAVRIDDAAYIRTKAVPCLLAIYEFACAGAYFGANPVVGDARWFVVLGYRH